MNEFLTVLLSRGEHKLRIIEEHAYRIILSFTFVSKRKYLFPPPPFDLIIERFNLIVMKKKKNVNYRIFVVFQLRWQS